MSTITIPDPAKVQAIQTEDEAVAFLRQFTPHCVSVHRQHWSYRPGFDETRWVASAHIEEHRCISSKSWLSMGEAIADLLMRLEAESLPA